MVRIMLAAFLLLALTVIASAQTPCGDTRLMAESLLKKYKEVPVVSGILTGGKGMFLVVSSPDGGFTLMLVRPDGRACIYAVGTNLEIIQLKGDES